jgi:cell division protein FtsI (penicillin-binding protein 3)
MDKFFSVYKELIKRINTFNFNHLLLLSLAFFTLCLFSCKKPVSTLDVLMQHTADSLLQSELGKSKSDSALVIVMSVKTGDIRTMLMVHKNYSTGKFIETSDQSLFAKVEPGPIFIPLSMMAAIDNKGLSIQEKVDAGDGQYVAHGKVIYDKDAFEKGGYGVITLKECIANPSFIGTVKTVDTVFSDNLSLFEKKIQKMSIGQPADNAIFAETPMFDSKLDALSLGYYFKISPVQLLTAYNAIANDGKMMKPAFYVMERGVINEHISSKKTIKDIQAVFKENGEKIFSNFGIGATRTIAAMKFVNSIKNTYSRSIVGSCCGYFPAENPEYSCLVMFFRSESQERNAEEGEKVVDASLLNVFRQIIAQAKMK